jgi:TolB-like protein
MSFIEELKRRNVFRVAVAYLVTAWVLLQVADIGVEHIAAPDWLIQAIMLVLVLGFPVALIFAWAFELTPDGIKKEKDVDRTQSITHRTGRKLDFTIIGILVVAVVFLLIDRFSGSGSEPAAEVLTAEIAESVEGVAEEAVEKAKSVAVLPFVNMSSDPEQEYFSDGISEEILNALAKVKELKVAGRTSSFAFKGQNQDLRQIGDTLGVENILEGSVRRSGTTVRITAQLIQVEDGFHLWSETYDRELTDVFAIQDEIAGAILQQLKAHLLDGEQIVVNTTRANSEAFDLYLLAKQRIYERTRPTLEAAAATLDRAIAIDPDYAPAYAQRGITALLLRDEQYGTLPKEQAQTQAKLYLDQALRLDPDQPEALAGMGLYHINIPGHTDEAIAFLEKSLAINPNLIDASNWLQSAYSNAGRLGETVAILRQMAERDPLYRPGIANMNRFQVFLGELDEAQAMVERLRPFMPNDPFLLRIEANIAYAKGDTAEGLTMVEQALELQPDNGPNLGMLGQGLLESAQYERALDERLPPDTRIEASWRLGRMEEATILVMELASSGEDLAGPIGFFANSGKPEQAIRYFEERWNSLDEFEKDVPLLGGNLTVMLDIAFAYGTVGNEERFNDAMKRSRSALDTIKALGFDNPYLTFFNAVYYTMSGDREQALQLLARAIDGGYLSGTSMRHGWSALEVLEGEPEYEAIQDRMIQHLNRERAKLGLEQLTT